MVIYAIEDVNEKTKSDKIISQKESNPVTEEELRQLLKDISFVNNYNLFVLVTSSLSIATILVNLLLIKFDTKKIIRAVT
jgi:hypothetical protein